MLTFADAAGPVVVKQIKEKNRKMTDLEAKGQWVAPFVSAQGSDLVLGEGGASSS